MDTKDEIGTGSAGRRTGQTRPRSASRPLKMPRSLAMLMIVFMLCGTAFLFPAEAYDKKSDIPEGFEIYLKVPEATVIKAVQLVIENDSIQGTWVYDTDKTLIDAVPETSSAYYGEYKGEGRVFYKVRHDALAPRHFKDSADIGIITVRYVVQGVAPNKTRVQIDAVFVEDGNHKVHASDTTVETSEFAEINAHLLHIHKEEQQTAELVKQRQKDDEARAAAKVRDQELARLNSAEASLKDLQARAHQLRHDVEVRVKNPNTELKAAPFQRSAKLQSLTEGTEVVIEIITPYWYGVETDQGQRGWLRQDQVEPLP